MEKFKSLADFLGVPDPRKPDAPVQPAPSPKLSRKEFCKEALATPEYRASLLRRIVMDTLPAAVEQMLYYYADGKPVEKFEVRDTTDPLDDCSVEQLEERAMRLLEVARKLREDEHSEPIEDEMRGSVH